MSISQSKGKLFIIQNNLLKLNYMVMVILIILLIFMVATMVMLQVDTLTMLVEARESEQDKLSLIQLALLDTQVEVILQEEVIPLEDIQVDILVEDLDMLQMDHHLMLLVEAMHLELEDIQVDRQ